MFNASTSDIQEKTKLEEAWNAFDDLFVFPSEESNMMRNKEFVENAISGLLKGTEIDSDSQIKIFELVHERHI